MIEWSMWRNKQNKAKKKYMLKIWYCKGFNRKVSLTEPWGVYVLIILKEYPFYGASCPNDNVKN